MNLASVYARYRGSPWFVLLLAVFLAFWFVAEWIDPSFDHGFGILNVILSGEASLSVALLIMATEKQDEVQRRQLKYMLTIMEATHAALVAQSVARGNSTEVAQDARVGSEGR